jgi:hypothetical protein
MHLYVVHKDNFIFTLLRVRSRLCNEPRMIVLYSYILNRVIRCQNNSAIEIAEGVLYLTCTSHSKMSYACLLFIF